MKSWIADDTMDVDHNKYMIQAVELAKQSKHEDGRVHPYVGAVIVTKTGKVVSARRGKPSAGAHAGFSALEELDPGEAAGATVFATLEPCTTRSHRTIPCANRLAEQKVETVFIAMLDPNPAICGRGVRRLRKHGVNVQLFPQDLMNEVEAMNADFIRHYESMSPSDSTSQEVVSLVNPRYDSDLAALDGKWKLESVVTRETIVVVTADTFIGELLDRPTAARIRDEIDRRGAPHKHRRAILIGNAVWQSSRMRSTCPTICIGSDEINQATKLIRASAAAHGMKEFPLPSGTAVFVNDEVPQIAIWGKLAADTHAAAVGYISAKQGLAEFLEICWK
jgi:pyrimidine deaminase RibD-like protein